MLTRPALGSEENDTSECVVFLRRGVSTLGGRLGIDVLADQGNALGQAVIQPHHTRRVALEQQWICIYLTRLFIVGKLEIRNAIAETDLQLVEFIGRLNVAAVGLARVAGGGGRQNEQARR